MATLAPCLAALRAEFNLIAPARDKASDGWIGDPAHQASKSDHNPDARGLVHAIDVDRDLRNGLTIQQVVDHLVARCRSGAERRLTYVIYNRRIASPVQNWAWRRYTGANPHDKHAHFSASYTTAHENDTSSWHLEDLVALTTDDIEKIARANWAYKIASPALGVAAKPAGDWLKDGEQVSRELATLGKSLLAAISALGAKDQVDEQALGAAIAPGLAAAVIAALPEDRDDITAEELQQAIVGALRELATPQPA